MQPAAVAMVEAASTTLLVCIDADTSAVPLASLERSLDDQGMAMALAAHGRLFEWRHLACLSRYLARTFALLLKEQWGTVPQCAVREALDEKEIVPVGLDPNTNCDGLFKERKSVLTAAHCAEASKAFIKCATGYSDGEVRQLLWDSAALKLNIITIKDSPRPPISQLQKDSRAMVSSLIKIARDRADKTVVVLFMGWLNDLLVQFAFDTKNITYQARVKQDGTNVLGTHGVKHSEGEVGDTVKSRMLRATCASPPFEPGKPSSLPRACAPLLTATRACCVGQSAVRPCCTCGSSRRESWCAR